MLARSLLAPSLALATILVSQTASAVTATSDQCALGSRDFTVSILTADTAGASCLAVGDGNLQGDNSDDALLRQFSNLVYIDKDNDGQVASGYTESIFSVSGINSATGTFAIDQSLWSVFDQ